MVWERGEGSAGAVALVSGEEYWRGFGGGGGPARWGRVVVCGGGVEVEGSLVWERRFWGFEGRVGGRDFIEGAVVGFLETWEGGSVRERCGPGEGGYSSKSIRVPILGPFGVVSAVDELEERAAFRGGNAGGVSSNVTTERRLGD